MSQSTIINIPVQSVNGETGAITLDNTDVGAAASIHTHIESDITDLGSYLKDAPSDGNIYGRQNAGWVEASGIGVEEAPANSLPYIRINETWEQPSIVSSGISSTGVGIKIKDASSANSYTIQSATETLAGAMPASDKVLINTLNSPIESNIKYAWTDNGWESLNESYDSGFIILDKTIAKTAGELQLELDSIGKDLNGNLLQINFYEGVHSLEQDLLIEGFYNGSINLLGLGSGLPVTSRVDTSFIRINKCSSNVTVSKLDFATNLLCESTKNILIISSSFDDSYTIISPTYAAFTTDINFQSCYFYNSPNYIVQCQRGNSNVFLDSCSGSNGPWNIASDNVNGYTSFLYNNFDINSLVQGDIDEWIKDKNIIVNIVRPTTVSADRVSGLNYGYTDGSWKFAIGIDGITEYYNTLAEAVGRVNGDLGGETLKVNVLDNGPSNPVLPSPGGIRSAGLDLSKFYNGDITIQGGSISGVQTTIELDSDTDCFIKLGYQVNAQIFNCNFVVPILNTYSSSILAAKNSESLDLVNYYNLYINNCTFDCINAIDNLGVIDKSFSNITCVECEFKTNASHTLSYVIDQVSVVYADYININWNFIDCITPTNISEKYNNIAGPIIPGQLIKGIITIYGNSDFVESSIVPNARTIINV